MCVLILRVTMQPVTVAIWHGDVSRPAMDCVSAVERGHHHGVNPGKAPSLATMRTAKLGVRLMRSPTCSNNLGLPGGGKGWFIAMAKLSGQDSLEIALAQLGHDWEVVLANDGSMCPRYYYV
jgi:hypothetical protein